MRDIDRIADAMAASFARIPIFEGIEPFVRDFAAAAKVKAETLRTDPDIFDVWAHFVTAGERLAAFGPQPAAPDPGGGKRGTRYSASTGIQLIRSGRDLVFYIARARTPMPKSTREYIERCNIYVATGRLPMMPIPLPA